MRVSTAGERMGIPMKAKPKKPKKRRKIRAVIGRPSGRQYRKPWRAAGGHDARAQEFMTKIFGMLPE